jgi:hypothetical protein
MIAIMGQGEGGMTALYAGALDESLAGVASLDYFQQRENCWQEPVDRVINGQLNEFGDAEVAALIAPRPLFVGTRRVRFRRASVTAEFARAQRFYKGLKAKGKLVTLEAAGKLDGSHRGENGDTARGNRKSQFARDYRANSTLAGQQALNQQFESWFQYLQKLISGQRPNPQECTGNSIPPRGEPHAEGRKAARGVGPTGGDNSS